MSLLYKSDLSKISNKSLTDKCIVLDLDETLVHTSENPNEILRLNIFTDCRYLKK